MATLYLWFHIMDYVHILIYNVILKLNFIRFKLIFARVKPVWQQQNLKY
jgi:hypothetical protein